MTSSGHVPRILDNSCNGVLQLLKEATMAARPPPARPHVGLNPSFHVHHSAEWGEDDAWDSASDSESPRPSTITNSWLPSSKSSSLSVSSPKPVPRPSPRPSASSSTLASSYTHLNAPSPSSYPPRGEQPEEQPQKSGWTIVHKSADPRSSAEEKEDNKGAGRADDPEVEGDMVVGSFEPDVVVELPAKPQPEQGSIRDDVEEIVNGKHPTMLMICISSVSRSPSRHPSPINQACGNAARRLP